MEKRIDLLKQGRRFLTEEGVTNARGEAEIFLSHILNCPRIELYLDNPAVEEKKSRDYWNLLIERSRGLPLQYLIGSTEFMGLKFKVAPGVFIPRPETEILVETALNLQLTTCGLGLNILDIGTGCGNIAASLAKELKKARLRQGFGGQAHIFACDISDSALQLAKENFSFNKVDICLVKSDLFAAFRKLNYFSLIVSNPPYINARVIPRLCRELHFEPRMAIDGGRDGLFYYRRIINEAPAYLQDKGMLLLEIGDNQADSVKEIIAQSGKFALVKVVRDYNNVERVIVAQRQKVK
ncbi:MAG: peptide chain release factor N(5)-glutamine methyltransferase [Candidatus Omnitrophica bacterium]|nr:peptide chain release factor N(5)-glutamine methyltransferase [Candidatus Omnitrophota bacterium]